MINYCFKWTWPKRYQQWELDYALEKASLFKHLTIQSARQITVTNNIQSAVSREYFATPTPRYTAQHWANATPFAQRQFGSLELLL